MINKICTLLQNKKILILGFGREGKSTYRFIRKHFPEKPVGIYDKNEIKESLQNVTIYQGDSYENIIPEYDLVFKSPGIVLSNTEDKILEKMSSQTDIFLQFYRDRTIGITGTKGKSTTSSLLYHELKHAGKDTVLVGNIGIPVFDQLENIHDETIVVFELSSHQLEYVKHSPHIGLLLNVYQEHLDHYGTFEKYVAAKENIYKFQKQGDLFVYNQEFTKPTNSLKAETITISNSLEDADAFVEANRIHYKGRQLEIHEEELLLKGQHNIYNIAAAYVIAKSFGVEDETFDQALKTFQPLPHRLEYVAEVDGVKFYNDSISTICETTIQGVNSIKDVDTVILGGMDRGIDYEPLADFLLESEIRNIILMPDTGYRIEKLIFDKDKNGNDKNILMVANVKEAVDTAKRTTMRGRTCLFSPAAASYGFFKNFEERGEVFKSFVLDKN
jgi:UDP-N-acetylmuramoyl-L-alanine---L-glutamate ligase